MVSPTLRGPIHPPPPLVGSVVEGFQWAVLSHPQTVALIDASTDVSLTYQQLAELVSAISRVLYSHLKQVSNHNPDGDLLVALCMPPSPRLVATILAVMQMGAA
ncbi:uncharacterized protein LOC125179380, partial [Hyalella azteca]|uniref:Uncharacterized protein LOC125179380 n=1 Tax=Hyalella azteca TaxID=294128 RepID=A0A979FWY8_HYAAZ